MSTEIRLFLTLFIIYTFFIHWTGYNENTRFFLTKVIVDEKRININSYYNQTSDRAYYKGNYYSDKAPGSSFLATLVYTAWKLMYNFFPNSFKEKYAPSSEYITTYVNKVPIIEYVNPGFFTLISMIIVTIFTSCLFSALTAVLIYKFSGYFIKNEKHRIITTFTYGLGSLAFPYALVFLGNSVGTFFIFLSFFLLFKIKRTKNYKTILSGVLCGFAILTEYSTIFIAISLLLYLTFQSRKSIPLFLSGIIIGLLPLFIYNYLIFQNPFELTTKYVDPKIWGPVKSSFWHGGPLTLESILPNPYIIYRLTFDPYRGLFFYYPILLISLIGMIPMYKEYKYETYLILSVLLLIPVVSTRYDWWGGTVFGAKHLLPITPFLVLPLSYILQRNDNIVYIFLVLSVFVNLIGIQTPEDWFRANDRVNPRYPKLQHSFQILANPLKDRYFPLFVRYGPRSRIFENLMNKRIDIDIRDIPLSREKNFPFLGIYKPFLSLILLIALIFLLWFGKMTLKPLFLCCKAPFNLFLRSHIDFR